MLLTIRALNNILDIKNTNFLPSFYCRPQMIKQDSAISTGYLGSCYANTNALTGIMVPK